MNFTTIEQSKRLLELGLSPDSADMKLNYDYNEHRNVEIPVMDTFKNWDDPYNKAIPCWSVGALLELLKYPKLYEDQLGDEDVWFCESFIEKWGEYYQGGARKTQIDAVYTLICWLLQNDYIKTKQS